MGQGANTVIARIVMIDEVHWGDLMPECLWKIRYRGLGPLTVAIDARGNNLYAGVAQTVNERRPGLYRQLGVEG